MSAIPLPWYDHSEEAASGDYWDAGMRGSGFVYGGSADNAAAGGRRRDRGGRFGSAFSAAAGSGGSANDDAAGSREGQGGGDGIMDIIPYQGSSFMPGSLPFSSGLTVWDLPTNKFKTTAVAATFVVTAGMITLLATGGLLAILVTGAVVAVCVLLLVAVATGLVALIVTGVPIGYALWRFISAQQAHRMGAAWHAGGWDG